MNIHKEHKPNLEDLMLALRRQIVDVCRKEGVQYELTFSQIEILRFLGENGKVTMKDIATHLKITPPSATSIVAEMQTKNLIKRIQSKTDRRIVSIVLTDKAEKLFRKISKHKQTILSKMLNRLSATDQQNLERMIITLINK